MLQNAVRFVAPILIAVVLLVGDLKLCQSSPPEPILRQQAVLSDRQEQRRGDTHSSDTIDFLSYALKADAGTGLASGDGFVWHQIVQGNNYYLEKWTSPQQIVHYWYDDNNIYMTEDTTGPHPYTFNPGVWARRQMKVGEIITMRANRIHFLNSACQVDQDEGICPYHNTLEAHYPQYDLGGDLGVQDVIVLKYVWGPPSFSNVEREYYAKGYGIVKWAWWSEGQLVSTVTTNLVANYGPVPIDPVCADLNHPNSSDDPTLVRPRADASGIGLRDSSTPGCARSDHNAESPKRTLPEKT